MLFLGLLLLAGAGAFTALAILGNLSGGPKYTVSVLGHDIASMNGLALFSSGLALALIFCLGLAMMSASAVHRRRHRRPRTPWRRGTRDTTTLGPA
jgi:membrane protein implicated in regulation of membrane protease activity